MPELQPFWTHAFDLTHEIRTLPNVVAWRNEQLAKIAELQEGTHAGRRDKDGNPVAKPPVEGPEAWFDYTINVCGIGMEITVRCNQTGDTLPLSDPNEQW